MDAGISAPDRRYYGMSVPSISELRSLDQAHHLHPFTNHAEMHPIGTHIIESGEGIYVTEKGGRRLLDGLAGLWCVNVGYGHRELIGAITSQLSKLSYYPSFFNSTSEPAILLAARLAALAPKRLTNTIFSNSGSEANETALKLIRQYWKLKNQPTRKKIMAREFAYHGVTLATTSLTGLQNCLDPYDLPLPDFVVRAPAPYAYVATENLDPVEFGKLRLRQTAELIEREGPSTIAAFFAEPIQGAGGVIVPPDGYLKDLRQLCREHGILFVADEVISGFGRLGDWFGSTIWDLDPDVMNLAKGITSGYLPLGATMVSEEIADVIIHGGYLAHGFTYSGHPVPCAAAMANLDIIEKEQLISVTRDVLAPHFHKRLQALADHPVVGEVRGYGLIGAIELLPPGGKAALRPGLNLGLQAAAIAREEGVIVRGIRDLIAMAPPLVISVSQIDELFDAIKKTLDRMRD